MRSYLRRFFVILVTLLFISGMPGGSAVVFAEGETVVDQDRPNNKFGIHIAKPHDEDIYKAAELVNSNGGGWGYVTVVMQEHERDREVWQSFFDKMRERKLIPIVRIGTVGEGDNWRRPSPDEAGQWADFLDSLEWPVKRRYVILFNEPNHAQEWGGAADPYSYAAVAEKFARELKGRSSDYVIMLAGLDAAAPSQPPRYMDSGNYLRTVIEEMGVEDYEQLIDAHASHSYANPAFAGPPDGSGKGTVRSYEYELDLIRDLGVEKELPVFITETGWDGDLIGRDKTAQYYRRVFEEVWLPDDRVRAVTPFILNYQGEPFLKFSFRQFESDQFYPQFDTLQQLEKTFGNPRRDEAGVIGVDLPTVLVEDSNYHFLVELENDGQGYWDTDHRYRFELSGVDAENYLLGDPVGIAPGQSTTLDLYVSTQDPTGTKEAQLRLYRDEQLVLESDPWWFEVKALPSLRAQIKYFPKFSTSGEEFEIQVFNPNEEMVFNRTGVKVMQSVAVIDAVRNITLGEEYRIVVLAPGYLPRQTYHTFGEGQNQIIFERLLPFDFDESGGLTWGDIPAFFADPSKISRFWP